MFVGICLITATLTSSVYYSNYWKGKCLQYVAFFIHFSSHLQNVHRGIAQMLQGDSDQHDTVPVLNLEGPLEGSSEEFPYLKIKYIYIILSFASNTHMKVNIQSRRGDFPYSDYSSLYRGGNFFKTG